MRRLALGPALSPSSLAWVAPRPVPRSDSRLRPVLHSLLPGPFPFRSRPGDLSLLLLFFKEVTVVMLVVVFCKSSVSSESALHRFPNPSLTLTFQRRVCPHLPQQVALPRLLLCPRCPLALSSAPSRGGCSPAAASRASCPLGGDLDPALALRPSPGPQLPAALLLLEGRVGCSS